MPFHQPYRELKGQLVGRATGVDRVDISRIIGSRVMKEGAEKANFHEDAVYWRVLGFLRHAQYILHPLQVSRLEYRVDVANSICAFFSSFFQPVF